MNLYLLIAIALGAVTGVTQSPMIRPSVILSREDGEGPRTAQDEVLRSAQDDRGAASACDTSIHFVPRAAKHLESPLTGAATPRAPATIR